MSKISFGSDPEFMLVDATGKLCSAIGIVRGTKEERLSLGGGHEAYYDNVLAECSIKPGKTKKEVIQNFRDCFKRFSSLVSPLKLVTRASGDYDKKECEHDDAQEFGCEPELCAYEMKVVTPPDVPGTFRSAGGHVHVGYEGGVTVEDEEEDFKVSWNRVWVVRMLDIIIGIPSLFIDKDPTSVKRRELYGNAGTHRVCDEYGVEYRPLSNFWLSSPNLVSLVHDVASHSVALVMEDKKHEQIWENEYNPEELRQAINKGNLKQAEKFLPLVEKHLPNAIWKKMKEEMKRDKPYDFYKEWEL